MEKIPAHNIMKFDPDTLEEVRKEFNLEKPGVIDAGIDILQDWVSKQAHFTKKDFPRSFLERALILSKGSVERAKTQLDSYLTLKTTTSHFYVKLDAKDKDYEILHQYYIDALLPQLTKERHRIYVAKFIKDGITAKIISNVYQFAVMFLEHLGMTDYASGLVGVIDFRDIALIDFISVFNLVEIHQMFTLLMQGYHMRVKGIYLVTSSKAIDLLVRMLKQVLSKKVGERIYVQSSIESLHQIIPKELLPADLGGQQKTVAELNKLWVEEFSKQENVDAFKEMTEAKVNEKLRNGSKPKDDILGISGSFRTLCVD